MTALMKAANNGELDCLKFVIAKGANLEAKDVVSAAPPAAPHPLCPSPSVLAACCPALTAAAHRVWRRRRASVGRRHGPQVCGWQRRARLPRAPHRQGRQRECHKRGERRPLRAAPTLLCPLLFALAARRSCCPTLAAAAYACGAAAVPPQEGDTALIGAALGGNLDCLEHLIAKGANLEAATGKVSAALPAATVLRPSLFRPRRPPPLLPCPNRRRSSRVAPPPRLRSTATRSSWRQRPTASSAASSTSSPRAPT